MGHDSDSELFSVYKSFFGQNYDVACHKGLDSACMTDIAVTGLILACFSPAVSLNYNSPDWFRAKSGAHFTADEHVWLEAQHDPFTSNR